MNGGRGGSDSSSSSSSRRRLILGHFLGQPLGLFLHFVVGPGLAAVVIDGGEAGLAFQLLAYVGVVAVEHGVDGIGAALVVEVGLLAGDDVDVDMRHTLACIYTILDGNIKRRGGEDTLYHARNALDSQKQVMDLCSRQVVEAGHDATGRDEDMTGQEGLEIDYSKGQTG